MMDGHLEADAEEELFKVPLMQSNLLMWTL